MCGLLSAAPVLPGIRTRTRPARRAFTSCNDEHASQDSFCDITRSRILLSLGHGHPFPQATEHDSHHARQREVPLNFTHQDQLNRLSGAHLRGCCSAVSWFPGKCQQFRSPHGTDTVRNNNARIHRQSAGQPRILSGPSTFARHNGYSNKLHASSRHYTTCRKQYGRNFVSIVN